MERPAAQIPPQFVCKASVSRLAVIVSLALTGALISVACVVEMDLPVRKCQALWSVPGKYQTGQKVMNSYSQSLIACMSKAF